MFVMVVGGGPVVFVSDTVAAERLRPPGAVSEAGGVAQEMECAP